MTSQFRRVLASNSGRTKEVVLLAKKLAAEGNRRRYALTANEGTILAGDVTKTWVLKCGWEQACAATKSVVEQALFYQSIISHVAARNMQQSLAGLDDKINEALTMPIDKAILDKACDARPSSSPATNDGVAERVDAENKRNHRKNPTTSKAVTPCMESKK